MHFCKYLNLRVRRIGKNNGKFFNNFSKKKKKKKKKNMKRLNFITQFKIEFLLSFSGCRKVLGKIPEHMCISLDMPNRTWNIVT